MFVFLFFLACIEKDTQSTDLNRVHLEIYPPVENHRAKGRHILISYERSWRAAVEITRSKEEAKERAEMLRQRVLDGEDFSILTRNFSDDPSKYNGGVTGVVERGMMVPEFETALFDLQINEVAAVTETGFGYHVIQRMPLEEVQLSHVLVEWEGLHNATTTRSKEEAYSIILEANQELKKNISPQTVAAKYSDGPFGSRGGSLGWFEREDLNPVFEEVCFTLAVSECSEPFESHLGYHIFCRSQ